MDVPPHCTSPGTGSSLNLDKPTNSLRTSEARVERLLRRPSGYTSSSKVKKSQALGLLLPETLNHFSEGNRTAKTPPGCDEKTTISRQ